MFLLRKYPQIPLHSKRTKSCSLIFVQFYRRNIVKSLKYDYENFQLRETQLTPLFKSLLCYQAIKLTPDGMFFLGPLSKSYLIHAPFIKKKLRIQVSSLFSEVFFYYLFSSDIPCCARGCICYNSNIINIIVEGLFKDTIIDMRTCKLAYRQ